MTRRKKWVRLIFLSLAGAGCLVFLGPGLDSADPHSLRWLSLGLAIMLLGFCGLVVFELNAHRKG